MDLIPKGEGARLAYEMLFMSIFLIQVNFIDFIIASTSVILNRPLSVSWIKPFFFFIWIDHLKTSSLFGNVYNDIVFVYTNSVKCRKGN